MQNLFDYLVGRPMTEDGWIPGFNFFEIFMILFKPSGKKADIHKKKNLPLGRFLNQI
jgi:hypothetical protein